MLPRAFWRRACHCGAVGDLLTCALRPPQSSLAAHHACPGLQNLQVKYVVELARALAQHPAVYRVDLLTRLIADPAVDKTYAEPKEVLWRAPNETGLGGAHIVRLPCGPPKTYLRCAPPTNRGASSHPCLSLLPWGGSACAFGAVAFDCHLASQPLRPCSVLLSVREVDA